VESQYHLFGYQTTFEEVKKCLISAPASSRLGERVFLWTDASLVSFGAVLEQDLSDGEQVPIAYASRATTAAEQKYGITELCQP